MYASLSLERALNGVLSFSYLSDINERGNIMEHIVQFAIGIDDDAIKRRVIDCAYNDVVKQLMVEAKRETKLEGTSYWKKESWSNLIERALHDYFDENKDMIIDVAATKLVDSYKRTKAFKETMASRLEEI